MSNRLDRRAFLGLAGTGAAGLLVTSGARSTPAATRPGFPHQDPALVRQVVQFSHFDLDAVRELVSGRPELAKASWDWGFGDWENGLGAASHVGRRPIAEYLLANGARPNIFTFAMLGHVDVVRGMVRADPGVQRIPGPHGLSLLHHARAGGSASEAVVEYLEGLGDADPRATDLPLSAEERRAYTGTYRFGADEGSTFQIVDRREHLAFRYGEEAPRNLLYQGRREFHPVGAPGVRFAFDPREGAITGVTIRAGRESIVAARVT